jgi:NitT/TauT family transport system substrate-binding protein
LAQHYDAGTTMLIRALVAALVGLTLFAVGTPAPAQERLRLAWAGISPALSPIWAMQENKFLQKQGVDAQIVAISSSITVIQALMAGEIDAASTGVNVLVSSRLAGADTVMVLGGVPTFVDHLVSAPTITSIDQLKGRIAGVNRLGSTSDQALRLTLKRLGINPDKDVKIIPVGGAPERFAALSKNVIHFTIVGEPFVYEAEKLGLRDLFPIASLKIPFWQNALLVRESTLNSKRSLILKLVRANIEGVHFIKTNKDGAKTLFKKFLGLTNPEGLERAYRDFSAIFPEAPYPTPEGVKTMLDDIAANNPKAAAADPRTFVDPSLVKEVEASGFIKQLYRR